MRRKAGNILMILGALLIAGALALFLWNRREASRAGQAAARVVPILIEAMEEQSGVTVGPGTDSAVTLTDGYEYIGILTIPALELELPVMSTWSYAQLKLSPCCYSGAVATGDLVISGHNYEQHFGKLKYLYEGDEIYFTDMNGVTYAYTVAEVDVLEPTAIEEMTSGEFPLTLFTCTYNGKSRVTVRCNRADG